MKTLTKLVISCLLIALTISGYSQNEPGIKWRAMDWPLLESTTGLPQSRSESGEDWWYDHKNVFDGNGNHTGYIAAGFTQGLNRVDDYEIDEGGCLSCAPGGPDCTRLESPGHISSCTRTLMFEYDKSGNMKWCRTYHSGDFTSVIQTSDGGFLAGGYTFSTRNPDNLASWASGTRGRAPGVSGNEVKELLYNPDGSNSDYFGSPCNQYTLQNSGGNPINFTRVGVVKTNSDGKIIWNYQYGYEDFISNGEKAYNQQITWVDLLEFDGDYWVIAGFTSYNDNGSGVGVVDKTGTFIARINTDGELIDKQLVPLSSSLGIGNASVKAYSARIDENDDALYLGGRYFHNNFTFGTADRVQGYIARFDISSPSSISVDWDKTFSQTNNNNIITDLELKTSGGINNLVVPVLEDCNGGCLYAGDNRSTGRVYILNRSNGNTSSSVSIGKVNAFDMKIGITKTADGGFAIISSRGKYDSNDQLTPSSATDPDISPHIDMTCRDQWNNLAYDFDHWDTDAYVVKFNSSNAIEWSKQFDAHENIRQPYPGDLKHQECMYAITEDPVTGELVVSGNSSGNLDDAYIAKLSDCQTTITDYFDESDANGLQFTDFISSDQSGFNLRGLPHDQIIISDDQTWDATTLAASQKIRGVIRIEDNATLTVDGITLEFAEHGQSGQWSFILVEPGGKLEAINGAKFTSIQSCESSTWAGIQVATRKYPPAPLNPLAEFGVVDLDGSGGTIIVEDAEDAIATGDFFNIKDNYWSSLGGVIYCNKVEFRNNLRDVAIMKWDFQGSPALNTPYPADFIDCKFIKDQQFEKPRVSRGGSISIWDAHQIEFVDCIWDFSGVDYEDQDVLAAFYTIDASFKVRGTATSGEATSRFVNCNYGIFSQKTWAYTSTIEVENTTFEMTKKGIFAYGADHYIFKNNRFEIPSVPLSREDLIDAYGIFVRAPSSYYVSGNTFVGETNGTGYNAGLIASDNWDLPKSVDNNSFSKLTIGSQSNLSNRNSDGSVGLEYKCNDFSENERDIHVLWQWHTLGDPGAGAMSGIRIDQGINSGVSSDLAGNLFTDDQFSSLAFNIDYTDLNNHILYRYHNPAISGNNPDRLKPEEVNGNVFLPSPFSLSYAGACQSPGTILTKTQWTNLITESNNSAVEIADILINSIDEDDTEYYLNLVENAQEGEGEDVFNQLMSIAPYISIDVLRALAQNHSISTERVKDIMLICSDGPKDALVWEYLLQRDDIDNYIDDFTTAKNSSSEKEDLQSLYAYYLTEKYKAVEGLKGWYMDNLESEENVYEDLVSLYGDQPTAQYQYRKAALQQTMGDNNDAQTTLSNMTSMGFTDEEMAFHDDYVTFSNYIEKFNTNDFTENNRFDFSPDEKSFIDALIDEGGHPLSAHALALNNNVREVNQLFQTETITKTEIETIDPVYVPGMTYLRTSSEQIEKELPPVEDGLKLSIFPNPNSGTFNIQLSNEVNGIATLYDLRGVVIKQVEIIDGNATIKLNDTPSTGMYIIRVQDEAGNTKSKKVFIQN